MTYVYIHLNNDLTMQERQPRRLPERRLLGARAEERPDASGAASSSATSATRGTRTGSSRTSTSRCATPSGRAINPFTYLNKAKRLLYPRPAAADPIRLILRRAKVVSVGAGTLTVQTTRESASRANPPVMPAGARSSWPFRQKRSSNGSPRTGRVAADLASVQPGNGRLGQHVQLRAFLGRPERRRGRALAVGYESRVY